MRLLDRAMAAVSGGEVTAVGAIGDIYCRLMSACEHAADVRRAEQWMAAADRLVAWQDFVAPTCRCHYGGILIAVGRWGEAEAQLQVALEAFERGYRGERISALVRLAELRARQGRHAEAERLLEGSEWHPMARQSLASIAMARSDLAIAEELARSCFEGTDAADPGAGRCWSCSSTCSWRGTTCPAPARRWRSSTELGRTLRRRPRRRRAGARHRARARGRGRRGRGGAAPGRGRALLRARPAAGGGAGAARSRAGRRRAQPGRRRGEARLALTAFERLGGAPRRRRGGRRAAGARGRRRPVAHARPRARSPRGSARSCRCSPAGLTNAEIERAPVHQPPHRRAPRGEHPLQARPAQPRRGRRVRGARGGAGHVGG